MLTRRSIHASSTQTTLRPHRRKREGGRATRRHYECLHGTMVPKAKDFWETLLANIAAIEESDKQSKRAAARVKDKVKLAMRRMRSVIDPDIGDVTDQIKISKVNVLNMLEFTERQANAAVSDHLEEILEDRKRATRSRDEGQKLAIYHSCGLCSGGGSTSSFLPRGILIQRYIASKVAREGRKFGCRSSWSRRDRGESTKMVPVRWASRDHEVDESRGPSSHQRSQRGN